MLDIKELTWEHHKNAERQAFVKILMSGKIDESLLLTLSFESFSELLSFFSAIKIPEKI